MNDLISRQDLYDKICRLENLAMENLSRTDFGTLEWKIWNAIQMERTAFKYDVCACPTIRVTTLVSEPLPDFTGEEREDG